MQATAKEKTDTASIHKIMSEGLLMVDRKIENDRQYSKNRRTWLAFIKGFNRHERNQQSRQRETSDQDTQKRAKTLIDELSIALKSENE